MYSEAEVNYVGNERVEISGRCVVTGRLFAVTVAHEALKRYLAGALAQDAFPELSKQDREFIVSGTSPEGWTELFGNKPEEEKEFVDTTAEKEPAYTGSQKLARETEEFEMKWKREKREDVWLMAVASASIGGPKDAIQIAQWGDQVLEEFDRRFRSGEP
jgi:ribosomal protein L31